MNYELLRYLFTSDKRKNRIQSSILGIVKCIKGLMAASLIPWAVVSAFLIDSMSMLQTI